jgi:hypothetical protein
MKDRLERRLINQFASPCVLVTTDGSHNAHAQRATGMPDGSKQSVAEHAGIKRVHTSLPEHSK